ncbi:MAG TPA: nuclear transport factor 2 family protein [Chitinophagaceae bacterium]|nr:nuclear transport factor 2 family protein [Chitinophagaceae bacterium]
MNNRIFLIMLCFLTGMKINAQSGKKDIESSIDALTKAIISQDSSMLVKLTANELSYGHSTGLVENQNEFVKDILSGPTKFFQIDNADQNISLAENNAIVRNICSIKGTKNGAPLNIKIGILMIWKKEGASWKLLARQGYKLE